MSAIDSMTMSAPFSRACWLALAPPTLPGRGSRHCHGINCAHNRVVGEMTIFPNYAQLPPYRPSGADDSEVILHPPSATEPDCIRPSVYQIASGSNEILCCVGQGLPSIEPARKIGNVAKPGAPQDTGRDRAAVTALAMYDEKFAAGELRGSIRQLTQGNPDGILHSAGLDFTGLADIQYRNVVLLFFQQVREFLHRDLRNVIQLIAAG